LTSAWRWIKEVVYFEMIVKLYEVVYMKCPHCDKEIQGVTCPKCNKEIPEESRYCLYCGAELTGSAPEDVEPKGAADEDDIGFEDRIPCSDGNCIGIIIGGKCNICGKPHKAKKK
jgi:hypothetical protein